MRSLINKYSLWSFVYHNPITFISGTLTFGIMMMLAIAGYWAILGAIYVIGWIVSFCIFSYFKDWKNEIATYVEDEYPFERYSSVILYSTFWFCIPLTFVLFIIALILQRIHSFIGNLRRVENNEK